MKDLKQRGMLDDTLVVFGSEFGRTPFAQGTLKAGLRPRPSRRQLHVVDGGRRRQGRIHPRRDRRLQLQHRRRIGVHIHDLNATLLYILGIDHERLTFKYQGRDFRLTDVHGKVVKQILA